MNGKVVLHSTIVLGNCPPSWWHMHGNKVNSTKTDPQNERNQIMLESRTVEVIIDRAENDSWRVGWRVLHQRISLDSDESGGQRFFTTNELLAAFGLNEFEGPSEGFNHEYGAHTAVPGKYIRYGRWLNIPCPGTACDGDPNVSIWVEETIQAAIIKLVESNVVPQ